MARSGREERRGRGEKQAFIIKYVRSCPPRVRADGSGTLGKVG